MAKKLPLLTLSTLALTISTLAATVPKSASATIFRDGTTWWTAAELLDYYQELIDEQATLCNGSTDCMRQYNEDKISENKYRALTNLIRNQFVITAINPKAETIKVLFFDQNAYHKIRGRATDDTPLISFYVAWFDDWQGQIFNFNRAQFTSGAIEGLHTVYDSIADNLDVANFPTWQEVEISVPGSDLASNTSGRIDFAAFGGNGYNSQGFSDYLGCLKDPNYQEGDECKIVTALGKGISYAPFHVESTPEPGPTTPTTEESSKNESNEPAEIKTPTLKAPETGAQTYPDAAYNREVHLPWWVAGLIIAGISLLIWLFVPNRRKSAKISKKSLDILTKVE